MKTMKGGIGVLALAFAASFLLLLPGCQGPASPRADRSGTVSLTIGQLDMSRAIQPDIDLSGFTGGFTAVFARPGHDSVTANIPHGETAAVVELPQGEWNLTVNALIGTTVAATFTDTIDVEPGFNGVNAVLAPIPAGGLGTFSWALTVPPGTTGALVIRTVGADGVIVMYPLVGYADFDGYPYPDSWEGELQLTAGAYFARFELTHGDYGVAVLNSDLHVYQGMTSRVARTFEEPHFSADVVPDIEIENAAVTVATPATGAVPVTTVVGANFAGTVSWTPADSRFQPETAYTATITLTANPGHVFATGATATINGQTATVTGSGATITLTHTFDATGPALEPLIAGWRVTGSDSFDAAIVGPDNVTIRPSSGVQDDARLQFLTQHEGELTPRVLVLGSTGINVRNAADDGASGLNDLANNAWWQTAISTTGRTDIAVMWRMRSTNTAPRDWQLQYRVGGTDEWNNVGDEIVLSAPTTPANTLNEPVQSRFLPSSAEGSDRLYLRWLMTSNYSVSTTLNDGLVVPGGTHQINDLAIRSGSTVSAANETPRGYLATVEGFVVGQTMTGAGTAVDNANIFLQDGTGPRDGILVWLSGGNLSAYIGQWVRVTGTVAQIGTGAGGAASPRNQITLANAQAITVIDAPANAPTFAPQPVELADIVAPNNDYWFMPISLERVQFGRNDDNRTDFLTAPGVNTAAAPGRSHFVIVEGGLRLELRPPVGTGVSPLDVFATGDYINITRAYVTWQSARTTPQLLHAVVVPAP